MEETNNEKFSLRLELRVKNSKLVQAREKLGLNAKEAAEKIGISHSTYVGAETMNIYPGPETRKKICEYYRNTGVFILEEEVFPIELRTVKPKRKYVTEKEIPKEYLISLSDPSLKRQQIPYKSPNISLVKKQIDIVLKSLTKREEIIIRLRFGLDSEPKTLQEVGEIFNLSRERIRWIERKALRKLRHSSRSGRLESIKDFDDIN